MIEKKTMLKFIFILLYLIEIKYNQFFFPYILAPSKE